MAGMSRACDILQREGIYMGLCCRVRVWFCCNIVISIVSLSLGGGVAVRHATRAEEETMPHSEEGWARRAAWEFLAFSAGHIMGFGGAKGLSWPAFLLPFLVNQMGRIGI